MKEVASKIKVGVVGCGVISGAYFETCGKFASLDMAACADLAPERARAKAEQYGIRALTVEQLLDDPEIGIVLNLTVPKAHHSVAMAALRAGKSVYNEKPLAITRAEGREMLETARTNGVRVGCAPDTFLGAGLQTCRKLIDDGWIGEPVAATAFLMGHGHECWHPDPAFYYETGGGPMFDMGPYYLTALVHLIGPVCRVAGATRITFPERTVTSAPKYGTKIRVETPTHIAGTMEFANGAIGTIITSFDVWAHTLPCIEIHGTEGSLSVPDPNGFGGAVRLKRAGGAEWKEIPHSHGYAENCRGIGPADMACGLLTGRPHRASGELAYHVLDVMHAFQDSSDSGRRVTLESDCSRPAPLPMGLAPWALDGNEFRDRIPRTR